MIPAKERKKEQVYTLLLSSAERERSCGVYEEDAALPLA